MNRVEALILKDQLAPPFEQSRLAASACETIPINRAGRNCVELNLRAQIARHRFNHRALSRFRNRIISAVRISHGKIFFATEVGRHVEDIARALRLHDRHHMVHQDEVRNEIGIKRIIPSVETHINDHVFGPGNPGIVDEIVDPPKCFERRIDCALQRIEIADVEPRQRLHTPFDPGKTDIL